MIFQVEGILREILPCWFKGRWTVLDKRHKRLFFIISLALLFMMALIFYFSSRPSSVSYIQSGFVTDLIIKLGLDRLLPDITGTGNLEANVRKLAHMVLYASLGFFAYAFFYLVFQYNKMIMIRLALAIPFSLLFSLCYASLDEFHQSFVQGRGDSISDVMVDMKGAVIGIWVSLLAFVIYNCLRIHSEK